MEYKKLLHMHGHHANMSSITILLTHMGPYLDLFMIMGNSKRMVLKVWDIFSLYEMKICLEYDNLLILQVINVRSIIDLLTHLGHYLDLFMIIEKQ